MRRASNVLLFIVVVALLWLVRTASSAPWSPVPLPVGNLPEPSHLSVHAGAPDPLVFFDGRRVTTKEEWGSSAGRRSRR